MNGWEELAKAAWLSYLGGALTKEEAEEDERRWNETGNDALVRKATWKGVARAVIEAAKGRNVSLLDFEVYDPKYGDDRKCVCGHAYYRHFDSYEDMAPVGCKYCLFDSCEGFTEKPSSTPSAPDDVSL